MSWLTNFVRPKIQALVRKAEVPDNLWDKCPNCGQMIFHRPLHPYTIGLMRSIPRGGGDVKRRLATIPGSVPDPFTLPKGCTFYPRCPAPKTPACQGPEDVPLTEVEPGHWVRCKLYQP